MQYFRTISEVISNYKNLAYPGRIYYELNKKTDFTESQFWVLSSKESKDDEWIEYDNQEIPISVAQYHAISFIDTGTFQDIIDVKLENNLILSIDADTPIFIEAIKYYLENNDFFD